MQTQHKGNNRGEQKGPGIADCRLDYVTTACMMWPLGMLRCLISVLLVRTLPEYSIVIFCGSTP